MSTAERRAVIHSEKKTQVWISDLAGIIPSLTGKIELVYEGEQEGPYQVSVNLIDKAIRSRFTHYFPAPEKKRQRKSAGETAVSPYEKIIRWFDSGNRLSIPVNLKDREKINALYSVDGLHALVKSKYASSDEMQTALLMEFVLHGLAAYSLISKRSIDGQTSFSDLMGSMLNLGGDDQGEDD